MSNSGSNEKKRNFSKSKQGKMNPKKPFEKVIQYDTEGSESENSIASPQVVRNISSTSTSSSSSSSSSSSASISTSDSPNYDNILLANLKGKEVLAGVDFCAVMSKKQGKGGSNLKGSELKKYIAWKEQKMVIAKLAFAGLNVSQMEEFLKSSKIHLTSSSAYNKVSSDLVANICNLLTNICFMENVDNGVLSDYFNRRVADIRNRRNYTAR